MSLTKKTVLITGSTRGIGLALATHYTEAGWNVIGTARATSNTDKLLALSPFKIVTMDTSDEASVAEAADKLQGVTIDLLINNAGTGWLTDIVPASKKLLMNTFEVNAVGPFLVTRALQPNLQLAARDHGFASVVQLSSLLGSVASNTENNAFIFRDQVAYSSSKAALNMVTRSLAVDLREKDIAVVAIHPGYVGTELTAGQGPLNPADVAGAISDIVAKLTLKDTGKFLNADPTMPGSELPW
ncbi:Short chain dehydrogenase [Phytophthora palmivora]|uniref:Short chain dehydrogenase n=1 Tax=Phytophthora palmivora TaxID=4796 RepID=A0A2P4YNW7_9STRA|nr:Short chain dehydrogenase [Phytophthora palmivora]